MRTSYRSRWSHRENCIAALVVFALAGCAQSGLERTAAAAAHLSPEASVYVAIPPDGRFWDHRYPGSGRRVAALVARSLTSRVAAVEMAGDEQAPAAALASARAGGFTYLAVPEILRWEDRAGGWSGMADAAEVRLALIETRSGDAADIAVLTGGGGTPSGGDRRGGASDTPEALLAAPVAAHFARLFPEPAPEPAHAAR